MSRPACVVAWSLACMLPAIQGCSEHLDAGSNVPHGRLPVDERNPVVIANDGPHDNWQGEYAFLLASAGQLDLAGLIVSAGPQWSDLEKNLAGWTELVAAARSSGMAHVPEPIRSEGPQLQRPDSGEIDATTPNRSAGAMSLIDAAYRVGRPYRPLVVAAGVRTTDIADAYLIDHSLPERVVVVSPLDAIAGSDPQNMTFTSNRPDLWADVIVTQRFRYVQVSAHYAQQTMDVPAERIADLPANAFGAWMAAKQPLILGDGAADQASVIAQVIPGYVLAIRTVACIVRDQHDASADGAADGSNAPGDGPIFGDTPDGNIWIVTSADGSVASTRFWTLLRDPAVFSH